LVPGVVSGPTSKPRFQTKPVNLVYDLPPIPAHLLKLADWLKGYYPAPLGLISQQILIANLTEKTIAKKLHTKFIKPRLVGLPPLTEEQQIALEAMENRDSYLLHGTTGSGKTRVYIELAARAIEAGKSAIILTPEISLTTQLASRFRDIFGERVIVMHSQQTPAERRDAWLGCLYSNEPVIVIGPRSALFSPVSRLGLIVLDEAHEAAYKQEQAPQYQTGRVAAALSALTRSSLILGSATPSVSDYFLAEQKQKPIVTLTKLAKAEPQAATEIVLVDRKEHDLFDRSPFLSKPLISAVEGALKRGEQALLYLNRRGTARLVMCENCGWQAICPHCDLPLTYHGDKHELRCHSCEHHEPAPSSCPACRHPSIMFKTAGTKAIVEDVKRLFPGARIQRFDTDNAKAERFEKHYEAIKNGEVDILVGTQLLAKGLDLPKLSTLGVLLADTSLYMPDYSAQERTFQLLNQVLGRIGRGHVAGRAIIQSYHPDHQIIQQAVDNNYADFYKAELETRKLFLFPPYCYLLKLTVRRASIKSAEEAADKFKDEIGRAGYKVRVEGPAPSFYERLQGKYQWQLIIKATERSELLRILENLPSNWSSDLDPVDLL
jgi:primosomal protein N' (replication factor Y)